MEKLRNFAFNLGFETRVLALLLQRPELFKEYPDIWEVNLFGDIQLRTIMRAFLHVRLRTGSPPSFASLENELIVKGSEDTGENRSIMEKNLPMVKRATLERLRELASCPTPDAEYDILGEVFPGVLHVESIGLLLGASKSYKTWNLLNAGIASAIGSSWMGFPDREPRRTLYCNMELHEEQLKARLDRICPAYGIGRSALKGKFDFLNLKDAYALSLGEEVENLVTDCERGATRAQLREIGYRRSLLALCSF
jgi:hypothetical protein